MTALKLCYDKFHSNDEAFPRHGGAATAVFSTPRPAKGGAELTSNRVSQPSLAATMGSFEAGQAAAEGGVLPEGPLARAGTEPGDAEGFSSRFAAAGFPVRLDAGAFCGDFLARARLAGCRFDLAVATAALASLRARLAALLACLKAFRACLYLAFAARARSRANSACFSASAALRTSPFNPAPGCVD